MPHHRLIVNDYNVTQDPCIEFLLLPDTDMDSHITLRSLPSLRKVNSVMTSFTANQSTDTMTKEMLGKPFYH